MACEVRRWLFAAVFVLASVPTIASADTQVDLLLKKLVAKGILTQTDAQEIRQEVASQPATPTDDDRLTKLEQAVADKTTVHVGKGSLKVGGLLQGWALYDARAKDRFRIRRSEIKLAGDVLGNDRLKYTVVFDPSQPQEDNTVRSPLKDAIFTIDHLPWLENHTLDFGQFKPPRTEEGTRPASQLDFAERSIMAMTYGDQRDLGAMVTGNWPVVTYQLGVFNGKQNQAAKHDQKDVVGRLVFRPLKLVGSLVKLPDIGELELGISGEHRPHGGIVPPKKRLGYEARYAYQNLALKGEYMTGEDTTSALSTSENNNVGQGWYTQVGYLLAPWFPKVQLVARLEGWDPDANTALDAERDVTLGLNYFIDKHNAKWQLNWVHQTKQTDKIDNQVISALQYAF